MVVVARPSTEVRAMRRDDLDAVVAIEHASYPFPWSAGIFRDCLQAGHNCWVIVHEGDIAGYGILSVAAGEAHVLNVCIGDAWRGLGYGRRMMRRLLDLARWYGVERVFLEVRPSNPVARALYDSLDFHEIGRRPGYYPAENGREEAIVMAFDMHRPD
ncbi:ribosomal-protein-alanine N-acetyltransferase [Luteibacter sp. 1214]|uniref:ribosomal protein S18-alanine N-acetyltransferase n=1 Tax=Luteibacter sp. 1214 TaxID=2817735 RepID=UPI002854D228|nr:ribosomal protein S18-alanine N-acetyltransferase [Luteibacter sp. 1214]MDR6643863.1 ribosomal-protein-alanine N-acetyltransferase [Luteibacter sp. 1214]